MSWQQMQQRVVVHSEGVLVSVVFQHLHETLNHM